MPKLLDLFCGAGGAAMGYHRAGFDVLGVDLHPQPRYPFPFVQADATTYPLDGYDVIHASPPCQGFTPVRAMHPDRVYPDLLTPTRARLAASGMPYVIENVPGAPMRAVVCLCGTMFGLGTDDAELWRHRWFETPYLMLCPPCRHRTKGRVIGVYGGYGRDHRRAHSTQSFTVAARRRAMDIDWMTSGELSQAIPPAYTEWIGRNLIDILETKEGTTDD
jgi:DNA (cytosine-5)-methyltransferase 1